MSCHISALCIALPCPETGLVETTFGERNSWRVETTSISPPFKSTNNNLSPLPPPCDGRGGGTFEESTFNVTPPVSHAEGGVQHLSLLRFMLEEKPTVGRPIFRSEWPHSHSVLHGGSDHRPEDGALSHLLSAPQSEQKSHSARSSQKGCTPKSLILS